jgi:formate-dependent nitrite reductase membrane component NrfD
MATRPLSTGPLVPPDLSPSQRILEVTTPGRVERSGYESIPFLKRPPWRWQIALYFSLEGISAGTYVLCTMAELFGHGKHKSMVRGARYLSLLTMMPAPALLIADLGRPERFHHMLRVFKPLSPMNLGAWALTSYSAPATLLALQQFDQQIQEQQTSSNRVIEEMMRIIPRPILRLMPSTLLSHLPSKMVAVAGLPSAFVMISYPGVLLSTTSTPVWTRTRFLGALISCSSISMATAAMSLVGRIADFESETVRVLDKIERVAATAEATALVAYLATTRSAAKPLVSGKYSPHFWIGFVGCGLLAPILLAPRHTGKNNKDVCSNTVGSKTKDVRSKTKDVRSNTEDVSRNKVRASIGSLLALAGGFILKWALTYSGRHSADDPKAARTATRPARSAPGWAPRSDSSEGLSQH